MVVLCNLHGLIVKEGRICHMDSDFQAVFMGKPLLGLENIKGFCQQLFIADILLFPMASHSSGILRHHFRPVDDIQNKFTHVPKLLS